MKCQNNTETWTEKFLFKKKFCELTVKRMSDV